METSGKKVVELNIEDVLPNRFQPRIKFNEEAINELSKSIKEHGVIQPIVVRPIGDKFEIIAGERRYKASRMADLKTIPAIITDLNDKDSAEVALIENVQRENLTPIEEAISYKKILDMGYITQDSLATKLGKTQSTVANKLRLLNLDDDVQEALLNEKISERHARSLLKLTSSEQQKQMLDKILKERLTVRRADEEIEKMLKGEPLNMNQEQTFENNDHIKENPHEENNDHIKENPHEENNDIFKNGFRFINQIPQEEQEEKTSSQIEEPETKEDELKPKKFFNILDNENEDKEQSRTEPLFNFEKMFINSNNISTKKQTNPLLEELNEIENSINNSNTLPPLFENENNENEEKEKAKEKVQETIEDKKDNSFDNFDDDMLFIEEDSEETSEPQNRFINIDREEQNTIAEQKIENFKDVLGEIRSCSNKIEKAGYEIETEEIDLDGTYQVIFKIKNEK